jgi:hypothetical protein
MLEERRMVNFRFLRIKRRFAGVWRIGVGENHRSIRRLDIGATHAKPPRGLTAALPTKLRIPSRSCRKDGSTPETVSRPGMKRHVVFGSSKYVARAGKSDRFDQVVFYRRDATGSHAYLFTFRGRLVARFDSLESITPIWANCLPPEALNNMIIHLTSFSLPRSHSAVLAWS